MIDYSPLWNTLKSKGINQYRLIRSYHFSSGQLHRIRNHVLQNMKPHLNVSGQKLNIIRSITTHLK